MYEQKGYVKLYSQVFKVFIFCLHDTLTRLHIISHSKTYNLIFDPKDY